MESKTLKASRRTNQAEKALRSSHVLSFASLAQHFVEKKYVNRTQNGGVQSVRKKIRAVSTNKDCQNTNPIIFKLRDIFFIL